MLKSKLLSILIATGMTLSAQAMAWEEDVITIWVSAQRGEGWQELGDLFTKETGINVIIETPADMAGDYESQAIQGQGPDILIWSHNSIGSWAQSELIAPVVPGAGVMAALNESFWRGAIYNDQIYGYPISVVGPTQICNAALVNQPFSTIDDVKNAATGLAEQGKKAFMWDYNSPYFTYGFLSAEGGFVFEDIDGVYNTEVTGINSDGAIAGAQMVKDLIDQGVTPGGVDINVMDSAFKAGEVACVINGPWAWETYTQAGIDILVGPYPKLDSGTPKVFTGLLTALINASSPNQASAVDFIESYLLTEDGLAVINDESPLFVVAHDKFMGVLSETNANYNNAFDVWASGEPTPNVPEQAYFWIYMQQALSALTQGQVSAEEALNAVADGIVK